MLGDIRLWVGPRLEHLLSTWDLSKSYGQPSLSQSTLSSWGFGGQIEVLGVLETEYSPPSSLGSGKRERETTGYEPLEIVSLCLSKLQTRYTLFPLRSEAVSGIE